MDELEDRFDLTYGYKPDHHHEMLARIESIVNDSESKQAWLKKRDNMLKFWEDPTGVFLKPFNRDTGWTIYNGEHADALVIWMEDLSAVGENVISEFLNIPHKIFLYQSNVRSQTHAAKACSYVKNNVKIDRKLCEKVYASQFVRDFYSDTQIDRMIEKWSNGVQP